MNHEEIKLHVALSMVNGLGAGRIIKLKQAFSKPADIFEASESELLSLPGFGKVLAANITSFDRWDEVDRILSVTEGTDVWMLTADHDHYPDRLRHIYDPPSLIWGRGNMEALSKPGIAVIGTRKPTSYGRDRAGWFAGGIAETGLSVISGLAYGIDTIAHTAAVDRNGCTIGVLGSGIDRIYPSANKRLVERIIEKNGAIISEFVPGTKPDRENFPTRNRVVSGISLGVLVVESDVTGGSMITAYAALDQGREVFAIPHDITTPTGQGCNNMIKKGHAKLTMNLQDILEELNIDASLINPQKLIKDEQPTLFGMENSNGDGDISQKLPKKTQAAWKSAEDLSDDVLAICKILEEKKELHIDDLAEQINMPGHLLLGKLLVMELDGLIEAKSGKRFRLK